MDTYKMNEKVVYGMQVFVIYKNNVPVHEFLNEAYAERRLNELKADKIKPKKYAEPRVIDYRNI